MTQRVVVFTGLVRNEAKFLEFLNAYDKDAPEGRPPLYFSTWKGELEKYPVVKDSLNRLGATILEQRQPDLVLPGHVLHQLVALDLPLSVIDSDTFVYKSRPDFADFAAYRSFRESVPEPVLDGRFGNIAPRNKFQIVGFFAAHPLYINDITYCGVARDLYKITSLPFTAMTRYNRIAPEQLIWGGALLNRIRVLDRYFRSNVGLIFDDEPKTLAHIDILKKSTCYAHALATYFTILNALFSDLHSTHRSPSEDVVDCTLEEFLWRPVNDPRVVMHPTAFTNSVKEIGLISRILAGKFRNSSFGDLFLKALSDQNSLEYPEDYMTDEIERSALAYEDAVKELNIGGGKGIRYKAGKFQLEGAPPKWIQEQTGTPLTQALETEVNYLRRVNNELQERLQKVST